jgi:hypothetical protein
MPPSLAHIVMAQGKLSQNLIRSEGGFVLTPLQKMQVGLVMSQAEIINKLKETNKAILGAAKAGINPVNGCTMECLYHASPGNGHSNHCYLTRMAIAMAEKEAGQ